MTFRPRRSSVAGSNGSWASARRRPRWRLRSSNVHVRRVFLRTGIAEHDDQQHMIQRARLRNPERPGALDYPAWWIGHEWCRPSEPLCPACPIEATCPKLIERAAGVTSA